MGRCVVGTLQANITTRVHEAGYQLLRIEQLRPNRWQLWLIDPDGIQVLALAQQRHLISASDVQDLAEMLRLSNCTYGMLLAIDGTFSPEAQRTAAELRKPRIQLCLDLPPAGPPPQAKPVLGPI